MNKIIDISIELSENLVKWPGDPAIKFSSHKSIEYGDKANVLKICSGSHAGTHIDAPYHFLKNGNTIDKMKLESLIGPCFIKEINGTAIKKSDLKNIKKNKYKRILFKTKNSKRRLLFKKKFTPDYVYLSLPAAYECIKKGIKVIGIDYLSIEKYKGDGSVHNLLLKNKIIIIEGLDLRRVKEKEYYLIALPLKIKKGDGAPSRVVLMDIK